jgi:hypothetical protein
VASANRGSSGSHSAFAPRPAKKVKAQIVTMTTCGQPRRRLNAESTRPARTVTDLRLPSVVITLAADDISTDATQRLIIVHMFNSFCGMLIARGGRWSAEWGGRR